MNAMSIVATIKIDKQEEPRREITNRDRVGGIVARR